MRTIGDLMRILSTISLLLSLLFTLSACGGKPASDEKYEATINSLNENIPKMRKDQWGYDHFVVARDALLKVGPDGLSVPIITATEFGADNPRLFIHWIADDLNISGVRINHGEETMDVLIHSDDELSHIRQRSNESVLGGHSFSLDDAQEATVRSWLDDDSQVVTINLLRDGSVVSEPSPFTIAEPTMEN